MSRPGKPGDDPFSGLDPFASVPDVDERLADWVDGTMSQRDRDRFEAEMRVSPHLREQVADYEATVASIREALNDETHETDLADRVMASLAQEATGAGRPTRSGWPFVWAVMSAAALLGVAVLIDSWGGSMLTPKTRTGTAAHGNSGREDSVGANAADSTDAESGFANSGDGQPGNRPPAVGSSAPSTPATAAPVRATPGFEISKSASAANQPADKQAAPAESNELPSQEGVAAGKAGGGSEKPMAAELVKDLEEAEASKLAKKMRSESGEEKADRTQLEVQERGRAAVPEGAPVKPRLVRPAGPGSPAPMPFGPTGPRAGGPTTGGPAGPTAGGPGTGRGGRRARRDSRNRPVNPSGGAPLLGGGSTPTATTGAPVEESATPKAVRSPGEAAPFVADEGRGNPDPTAADNKRRKDGSYASGFNGRALAQRPKDGPRQYLMRLSEQKSVGEVLPLVIVDGYAVQTTAVKGLVAGSDPLRTPETGSDDFYLGSTRRAGLPDLRPFFDLQMRPGATSNESRVDRAENDAASLGTGDPDSFSIGGLQLFAVGPVAPGEMDDQGKVREAKTKSMPQAKTKENPKQLAIPGEWDASGGAPEQRDWLVVGPRSEVAKLLVALRKYSDDVVTRTCRTGEVRLVNSESKLDDRAQDRANVPAASASEPEPSSVPLGSGGGSVSKPSVSKPSGPKPSTPRPSPSKPSEAAQAEPTQRVVIRFRVRR